MLSFHTDNQGNDGTKDWTKFCQDSRRQNLVQSSVLSFPTGGQEHDSNEGLDQILPGHSRAKFGPILCAVISLQVVKDMTAKRIGPNFARTVVGKIWSNPLCCHFLQVAKNMTATKDWTKFCQDIRGQNLVQSSVLSFPTGGQGHDSKEDWTKFCEDICRQNLVQSYYAVISYR